MSGGGGIAALRQWRTTNAPAAEIASIELPGSHIGTPMTYMHDGRQYIAVTISANPPQLVAFRLPEQN